MTTRHRSACIRAGEWLSLAAAALLVAATINAGTAHAATTLTAGMRILIGDHSCTLGFFGNNSRRDRLAVTAGHCSDRPGQRVYIAGRPIGHVVARRDDRRYRSGQCCQRGYTLIALSARVAIAPFFTAVGVPTEGDAVRKYGSRTQGTTGEITRVILHPADPDKSVTTATVIQLAGDSGAPWYRAGPTLIAMASSGTTEHTHRASSQAQPVTEVLKLIRRGAGSWGANFTIWLA